MGCATSSVDTVSNGHCVGSSLRAFEYMDIDFTFAFLAGGGHKDLCLLDSQLLERLIGGASIDGMFCSLEKDSDGGVGGVGGTAGTPALQSNQSPTKEYSGQP